MANESYILRTNWKPAAERTEGNGGVARGLAENDGAKNSEATSVGQAVGGGILAERWPTLATAMGRYQQNVAEAFTMLAYDCVQSGLIRLDNRKRLAAQAEEMGLRAFDAQLLIACAVRQWAIDHRYDGTPSRAAPKLSMEYRNWSRAWMRFAIVAALAVTLDGIILWRWLG